MRSALPKFPTLQIPVLTHADAERVLDARVAPLGVQLCEAPLHIKRHPHAGPGVLRFSIGFRIAKKDQNGIADEFVNRAPMRDGGIRHLGEILIEQLSDLLGLQPLSGRGKILDVGKENRELLALGMDRDILFTAKNSFVNLRRQLTGDFHR
jgi:hypothetical protein